MSSTPIAQRDRRRFLQNAAAALGTSILICPRHAVAAQAPRTNVLTMDRPHRRGMHPSAPKPAQPNPQAIFDIRRRFKRSDEAPWNNCCPHNLNLQPVPLELQFTYQDLFRVPLLFRDTSLVTRLLRQG